MKMIASNGMNRAKINQAEIVSMFIHILQESRKEVCCDLGLGAMRAVSHPSAVTA
jgi:hypothetical protein